MAAGDARDYVLAFENNKAEAARIASNTAQKLQNDETNLLEVVKALGEYITDDDDQIRTRAVNYLTAIVQALPPRYLNRQQIQVLNTFLSSRIEDGGAIEGLSRLQSLDRYTKEMAQDLAQTIFDHFSQDLQSRPQAGRYKIYTLLNELLSNHRKAIRDMGDRSLVGTVQVVAGEKDPRNLMLIFSMLRVIMIEWDISSHIDRLFDAVYAYFPITFRPPPNDPYGITAQDLKDRLRDCLSSTGLLAPSVFPNLLDRLDSSSEIVKKDVLQALAACALNYDPSTVSRFSITLWDAVKFEVLQAQEPFLADEALNVIKNIATCLSKRTGPHAPTADPLVQYLKPVNKECLEHLQEPASRQASAAGDILKAAASATVKSFEVVLKAVGPAFFTLQQSSEGIVNQRAILLVVNRLFEASIDVYGSWTVPSERNENGQLTLLAEFKDKLLAIYSRALMSTVKEEVSYRLAAAKGLLLLSQMAGLLGEDETGLIVQHFNEIVLDEESYGRDELKQRAMHALAEISQFKPRLITDITFPKFIARLPDSEEEAIKKNDYQSVLEGLAEISVGKDLLDTLMRRLLSKLDLLIQQDKRKDYPYTCAVISTMDYVLSRSARNSDVKLDGYIDRIVVNLSYKVSTAPTGPLINETVLDLLGRVINLIIRRSSEQHKEKAASNVYHLYGTPVAQKKTHPLEPSYFMFSTESALLLSTWILAALPRSSKAGILSQPLVPLVKDLTQIAATTNTEFVKCACIKQIELIVNKHITSKQDLDEIKEMYETAIAAMIFQGRNSHSNIKIESEVRYVFALSKALALRLVPGTDLVLRRLVELLEQLPLEQARFSALGFSTLLADCDVISKQNDAQIRLLAPQRVFQILVPLISSKFKDATSNQALKEIYLIALAGILGTVSSDIVMPELPTLLPLLLQSLEISDANQNVKIATLETTIVVITKNPDALIESGHIPALLRRLLSVATLSNPAKLNRKLKIEQNLAARSMNGSVDSHMELDSTHLQHPKLSPRSSSSPKTRQLAVRCISLLPEHVKNKTPNPLLSLKKEVLAGLVGVLDDPRRDVRKEAVDARAKWLRGVDEVDSEEDE
ncbi:hypothetical protein H2198_007854 [Neophaeococcomyces mojaviensis]|uniref:Uncharacterized protein n=1 Tax=Neophaeococcomyces mojaviensis TaxID=3383035 RepID=A0ACC2ZYV5_9EURO|nr:hypothetical protein H2198_007854 [Knufia sp. JES_112]